MEGEKEVEGAGDADAAAAGGCADADGLLGEDGRQLKLDESAN